MKKDIKKPSQYDHLKIEKKWQKYWDKKKTFVAKEDPKKTKFYGLIEFPYPSGDGIHMGHVRTDTAMDVICRKKRMEGYNVLYPIGWDAFGLPTENYAIKTGIHPEIVTKNNSNNFRRQLKSIGFSFDWSREINTSDPTYYKWTQWIFLKFFEKGLAYKKKMLINWCPKCKTGLANEEVIDGCCERCGEKVEKKEKEQWMLAITKYADRLEKDLDDVNYLEKIKTQQKNWIGKSEGAEITFKLSNIDKNISVFTTRPDTLFGLSYVVIAPESEIVQQLKSNIKNWQEVEAYIKEVRNKPEIERTAEGKDKTGVILSGIKAINPVNKEEVPVFIADYVLAHYGTGAVMAVPAHDDRDYAFAKKYNLPIKEVIIPERIDKRNPPISGKEKVERKNVQAVVRNPKTGKYLIIHSRKFLWNTFPMGGINENENVIEAAKREVMEETGYTNLVNAKILCNQVRAEYFAKHKDQNRVSYTSLVSFDLENENQVEIAEKEKTDNEILWVEKDKLNLDYMCHAEMDVWLQKLNNSESAYIDDGIMVNSGQFNGRKNTEIMREITEFAGGKITTTYKLRDWIFSRQHYWGEPIPVVHCEKCGIVALKEKDLPLKLPHVKKYQPTDNGESPLASISKWVNTKCPKCGGKAKRETDTMPNWAGSSWYYLRYTDANNKKAFASVENLKYWMPVDWYNGGMEHTTLHLLYSRFWHKFLYDLKLVPTNEPYTKRTSQGFVLGEDGEKMSKSRGNVINPDGIVKTLGADSLRIYQMFMGPFDQSIAWSSNNIVGSRRFLEKVWKLQEKVTSKYEDSEDIILLLNQTIKKVGEDIESIGFNTAISGMMILTNNLENQEKISKQTFLSLIKILSPFAPHICEELNEIFGGKKSITLEKWPEYDEKKLSSSKANVVVQINGKFRATVEVGVDSSENEVKTEAMKDINVAKWLEDKNIVKTIFVKNKIINFVIQ